MNKIKLSEHIATAATIAAATSLAFFASEVNFVLIFFLFASSAMVFSVTAYIQKQSAFFRLQSFFAILNTIALIKLVV
jgi:hypothetical protein